MTFKTILAKARRCMRCERVSRASSIALAILRESSGKTVKGNLELFSPARAFVRLGLDQVGSGITYGDGT